MFVVILLITLTLSPTTQDYFNKNVLPVITAYEDYTQAVGSELYDAAFQKKVMITPDTPCSTTETSYYLPPGFFRPGMTIKYSDGQRARASHRCDVKCETSNTTEDLYDITSEGDKSSLTSGQNVVRPELMNESVTYFLDLSAGSISDGEEVLLTTTVLLDTVLLSINVSGATINLLLQHQQQQVYTQLELNVYNQIAILSDSKGGVAFLLNGAVLYSIVNAKVTELTLAPPTEVFAYEIEEWKIFDQLLTTQQLYSLRDGRQLSTAPAPECTCNSSFPIFVRWPNVREDPWMGLNCQSVGGGETARRIADGSYIPQFITDGDYISYWLSAKREIQHKLTIDLGADYQIFYSIVTFQTLPKYIVITKSASSINAVEEVLYVFSTDCSAPLPQSLPQARPLLCQNFTTIYRSKGDERSKQMVIDWTVDTLYPDGIVKDQNAFDQSLRDGVFKARCVSLYLYDFEAEAAAGYGVHAINEINVYGSHVLLSKWNSTDDLYLTPNGSVPCDCSVGSLHMSCDYNGQCQCRSDGTGDKPYLADNKCRAFVHSVTPRYGPQSGGTRILVEGGWLLTVEFVEMGPGRCYKQIDNSKSETEFYCLTPEGNDTVGVHTENTLPIVDFTYKPDPYISAIVSAETFVSGGVDITVKGTNLQSIAIPKILVTVICISTGEVVAVEQGDCTPMSDELMNCESPDLSDVLTNSSCYASSKRRRKRSDDINSRFAFSIGFLLDGVEEFADAAASPWLKQSSRMVVKPDPQINKFQELNQTKWLYMNATYFEIFGQNLDSGADIDDYSVSIGGGSCPSIVLYNHTIECYLSESIAESGFSTTAHAADSGVKLLPIIVKVGNIVADVGYLAYIAEVNVSATASPERASSMDTELNETTVVSTRAPATPTTTSTRSPATPTTTSTRSPATPTTTSTRSPATPTTTSTRSPATPTTTSIRSPVTPTTTSTRSITGATSEVGALLTKDKEKSISIVAIIVPVVGVLLAAVAAVVVTVHVKRRRRSEVPPQGSGAENKPSLVPDEEQLYKEEDLKQSPTEELSQSQHTKPNN